MKRQPTHPGVILAKDIVPKLQISISALAEVLCTSRQHFHRLLKGDTPVTPDMAVRIGALVGNDPRFWLNLQNAYDVWAAEQSNAEEIAHIQEARQKISVVEGARSPLVETSLVGTYENTTAA
jgi:addiction module HigA family antidote